MQIAQRSEQIATRGSIGFGKTILNSTGFPQNLNW